MDNLTWDEISKAFQEIKDALNNGAKIKKTTVKRSLSHLVVSPPSRYGMVSEIGASASLLLPCGPGTDEDLSSEDVAQLASQLKKISEIGIKLHKNVFLALVNAILESRPQTNPSDHKAPSLSLAGPKQPKVDDSSKEFFSEPEAAEFLRFDRKKLAQNEERRYRA